MSSRSHGTESPEVCIFVVPLLNRGRRESRAPTAPVVPVQQKHGGRTTGTAETTRLSPRNGLRLIRALPGERRFLPPSSAGCARRLDATVAAPGPHDFA